MVTVVNLDQGWLPEREENRIDLPTDAYDNIIPGAFWYETETDLGPRRCNIPLSRLVMIDDPIIGPKIVANPDNGYRCFEPIPLQDAIAEAEKRGGEYLVHRGEIYFVFKRKNLSDNGIVVESNGFKAKTKIPRRLPVGIESMVSRYMGTRSKVFRYRLVDEGEGLRFLPYSKKMPELNLDSVEIFCSIPAISPDGRGRDMTELREIAGRSEADPVYLVKDVVRINGKDSWILFRDN